VSKPTIMPAITTMFLAWIRRTLSAIVPRPRLFTCLDAMISESARGDSMPMNASWKFACWRRSSTSGMSATLMVSSHANRTGNPSARPQSRSAARRRRVKRGSPMKFASVNATYWPPARRIDSTSAITCSTLLVRGRRPSVTMMSQNSQLKGHPRVVWMPK
jgi:hypothetical protein